jgi:hypothetical protein
MKVRPQLWRGFLIWEGGPSGGLSSENGLSKSFYTDQKPKSVFALSRLGCFDSTRKRNALKPCALRRNRES